MKAISMKTIVSWWAQSLWKVSQAHCTLLHLSSHINQVHPLWVILTLPGLVGVVMEHSSTPRPRDPVVEPIGPGLVVKHPTGHHLLPEGADCGWDGLPRAFGVDHKFNISNRIIVTKKTSSTCFLTLAQMTKSNKYTKNSYEYVFPQIASSAWRTFIF